MISLSFISSSLYQIEKAAEQGLIAFGQLPCLGLQCGILQLLRGGLALGAQVLGVAQRVFDIEQFFGTHPITSS